MKKVPLSIKILAPVFVLAAAGVAKKYGRRTPCAKTGKCTDCNSPECVCAVTAIHRRKPSARM